MSGGARSTAGALALLKYIDRHGDLELETDEGAKLRVGMPSVAWWRTGSSMSWPPDRVPLSGYCRAQALQTTSQHRAVYAGRYLASKAPGGQPKLRT